VSMPVPRRQRDYRSAQVDYDNLPVVANIDNPPPIPGIVSKKKRRHDHAALKTEGKVTP